MNNNDLGNFHKNQDGMPASLHATNNSLNNLWSSNNNLWTYVNWHKEVHVIDAINLYPNTINKDYDYQSDSLKNALAIFVRFDYSGIDGCTLISPYWKDYWSKSIIAGNYTDEYWNSVIQVSYNSYYGIIRFNIKYKGSSQLFENLRLTQVYYIS